LSIFVSPFLLTSAFETVSYLDLWSAKFSVLFLRFSLSSSSSLLSRTSFTDKGFAPGTKAYTHIKYYNAIYSINVASKNLTTTIIIMKIYLTLRESVEIENAGAMSAEVVIPQRRLLVALF
jgi:hypothetical protein